MRKVLSQERLPHIWNLFQYALDNTERPDIASTGLATSRTIVDIGCGTGRRIPSLRSVAPEARYIGLDIDPAALAVTTKRYPELHFELATGPSDLRNRVAANLHGPHSTAVLWNVTHHLDDDNFHDLLRVVGAAEKVLIIDPLRTDKFAHPASRFVYKLERGQHRRTIGEMTAIFDQQSFSVLNLEVGMIRPRIMFGMSAGGWAKFVVARKDTEPR